MGGIITESFNEEEYQEYLDGLSDDFFPEGTTDEQKRNTYLAFRQRALERKAARTKSFQALDQSVFQKKDPLAIKEEVPEYIIMGMDKNGNVLNKIDYFKYSTYLKEKFHVFYFNDELYLYDFANNVYRKQTNDIETHIRTTCEKYNITGYLYIHIKNLISHLSSMGFCPDYPFNYHPSQIPVKNGIVNINYETGEVSLLPHGPEHLFTFKLDASFNPASKNCKAISLLKRMVEPENIKTLCQIPAQAFLQMQSRHAYKKAYLLQGEPNAGKTSYLTLLFKLLGDDQFSQVSLQQLCSDRFVGGNLEGKIVNVFDDLEDVALEVIDQFKTFTGSCKHSIERKYQSQYIGIVSAVHVFTCNYPPEYPEKVERDAAFWARWEYVKFPFAYPVNPNFYEEWYTDDMISAFLNLIISTMITIKKQGLVSNSDTQAVMINWSVNSDPMYDFIDFMFEKNSSRKEQYFSKPKLFEEYKKWCFENKIPTHKMKNSLKAFTIALHGHSIIGDRKKETGDYYEVYKSVAYVKRPALNKIDLDYHPKLTT